MKAISPVRSARNNAQRPCEHALGITRSKSPLEDPLSLLYDMNDCYSMLKEMVPSLPQNKSVSKMEILQHVIDYILDLQNALDTGSPRGSPCQHHQLRHQQQPGETGSPLTAVTSDISMLNFQSSDLPKGADATDSGTLFR